MNHPWEGESPGIWKSDTFEDWATNKLREHDMCNFAGFNMEKWARWVQEYKGYPRLARHYALAETYLLF